MYTDLMVDVETTGTLPDRAAILQISAVKFNLKDRLVSPDFFNKSLTMPKTRFWDESTRSWWAGQNRSVYQEIVRAQEPYDQVMREFQQFCIPAGHYRFWSKPTHFDFMFISSYFNDLDLANPLSYREATDLNSFLRGAYFPHPVEDIDIPKQEGEAHNALVDVLYQLKILFAHADNLKNKITAEIV